MLVGLGVPKKKQILPERKETRRLRCRHQHKIMVSPCHLLSWHVFGSISFKKGINITLPKVGKKTAQLIQSMHWVFGFKTKNQTFRIKSWLYFRLSSYGFQPASGGHRTLYPMISTYLKLNSMKSNFTRPQMIEFIIIFIFILKTPKCSTIKNYVLPALHITQFMGCVMRDHASHEHNFLLKSGIFKF